VEVVEVLLGQVQLVVLVEQVVVVEELIMLLLTMSLEQQTLVEAEVEDLLHRYLAERVDQE
jgi:hypothetical protein